MIRLVFSLLHLLGGLLVKLLVLIVMNNLLYGYFTDQPWNLPSLLSLEALPDKMIWNIRALTPVVEEWTAYIREVGEPVIRQLIAVIEDWKNNG